METWDAQGHLILIYGNLLLLDLLVLCRDDELEALDFLAGDTLVVLEVFHELVESPNEGTNERVETDLEGRLHLVLLITRKIQIGLQLLDFLVRLLLSRLELLDHLPDALQLAIDQVLLVLQVDHVSLHSFGISLIHDLFALLATDGYTKTIECKRLF